MLDDQLLVYDPQNDRVHLLDATTAKVVELLDSGVAGEEIVDQLSQQHSLGTGADLLALTLDQLATAGLLAETKTAVATTLVDGTRRQLLQKVAAVGLGLLVPTILTLTPSRAYAQASGSGLGSSCESSADCLGGRVCGDVDGVRACMPAERNDVDPQTS